MTYDPKKRPNYLGLEWQRSSPDRLKSGVITMADQNENLIPKEAQPSVASNQLSSILGVLKIVAAVLAAGAGSIVAAAAGGAVIPGWLLSICTAIVAIAAPLGIVSNGVAKPQAKGGDVLK